MNAHVFRILIHIDVVEDLLFYHHPREELVQDGKVPWQEFMWQLGQANGDLEEEDLHPPTKVCGPDLGSLRRHLRDDDDPDCDHKKPRPRGFISRMTGCIEGRGRCRDRAPPPTWRSGGGWEGGESFRGRVRGSMQDESPQGMGTFSHEEKRTLEKLWNEEKLEQQPRNSEVQFRHSDAIVIEPHEEKVFHQSLNVQVQQPRVQASDVIVIHPQHEWTQTEHSLAGQSNAERISSDANGTSDIIVIYPQ
jgi:hypothetical protein